MEKNKFFNNYAKNPCIRTLCDLLDNNYLEENPSFIYAIDRKPITIIKYLEENNYENTERTVVQIVTRWTLFKNRFYENYKIAIEEKRKYTERDDIVFEKVHLPVYLRKSFGKYYSGFDVYHYYRGKDKKNESIADCYKLLLNEELFALFSKFLGVTYTRFTVVASQLDGKSLLHKKLNYRVNFLVNYIVLRKSICSSTGLALGTHSIAKEIGCTATNVSKYIGELVSAGIIVCVNRSYQVGAFSKRYYAEKEYVRKILDKYNGYSLKKVEPKYIEFRKYAMHEYDLSRMDDERLKWIASQYKNCDVLAECLYNSPNRYIAKLPSFNKFGLSIYGELCYLIRSKEKNVPYKDRKKLNCFKSGKNFYRKIIRFYKEDEIAEVIENVKKDVVFAYKGKIDSFNNCRNNYYRALLIADMKKVFDDGFMPRMVCASNTEIIDQTNTKLHVNDLMDYHEIVPVKENGVMVPKFSRFDMELINSNTFKFIAENGHTRYFRNDWRNPANDFLVRNQFASEEKFEGNKPLQIVIVPTWWYGSIADKNFFIKINEISIISYSKISKAYIKNRSEVVCDVLNLTKEELEEMDEDSFVEFDKRMVNKNIKYDDVEFFDAQTKYTEEHFKRDPDPEKTFKSFLERFANNPIHSPINLDKPAKNKDLIVYPYGFKDANTPEIHIKM